jgi:hypothetical protein
VCDRWRQVAGQRKIDLASARLAGVSRSEFPGRNPANLSEPTFRKLSRRLLPVKNVATALGFIGFLKPRPISPNLKNSVRLQIFARDSQPNLGFAPRRGNRCLFHWRQASPRFERCAALSNVGRVRPGETARELCELSFDLLSPVVTGGIPCEMVQTSDFPVLRAGRNCIESGLASAGKWFPATMISAHAPDWVLAPSPRNELCQSSFSASNPPAGTTPLPAKGFALHEKRDAHQCPPTGGEPDCHR